MERGGWVGVKALRENELTSNNDLRKEKKNPRTFQ